MQRQFTDKKLTAEEHIKNAGLILDFDEIARKGGMSKEEVLIAKKPSRRWQTNIPAVKFP
ncbi:MAG: hypothetical protein ACYS9H_07425 [Planctomycetota bacterium]|jgi:hypothetical protein